MGKSIILIFILGTIFRLSEFCANFGFENWWKKSWFYTIKNKFLFNWFKSSSTDEHRYIKIFNIKIYLHPIFWNGYHNFKNIGVCVLTAYLSYDIEGTIYEKLLHFFILNSIWYLSQKIVYFLMIRNNFKGGK